MPGMSGIELLRRLRLQRPELPVVLMSGYVSDDHLARLEALGGAQVLHKPFDAATVARALRRAIDDAVSP
jgi:CheY-like chemotaxis protein